jgi:tyrosinase
MGDNAYTAFDPLFLSYHANIDRMLEVWIRNHPGAQFTTQTPLQPFLGAGATDVSYSSADHWRYTSIGEMAQDSRRIGYDYGEPVAKQFTGDAARKKSPTAVKAKPSKPGKMAKEAGVSADPFVATRAEAKIMDDGPWVVFDDVRCTHDSYLIDVFINQADATPNDATSCNMHYVGRFSRIGMGLVDDKGRCVTQGVSRVLNAGPTIYSLDLRPEDKPQISLVVTHLDTGRVVGGSAPTDYWTDGTARLLFASLIITVTQETENVHTLCQIYVARPSGTQGLQKAWYGKRTVGF